MSVWGKITGIAAGYALAGVPGALVGGLVGHVFMDRSGDGDVAFTIALIALAAKMTRADGIVSPVEIDAVHQLLRVPEKERANMERVFRLAQADVAGFDSYARQIADLYKGQPETLEDVLDVLLSIAHADGVLHPAEQQFLEIVADIFGVDGAKFSQISARHGSAGIVDPYLVLGVSDKASNAEIRAAYHKAVRENHPDQLQARGMPADMLHVATARMAAINEAWKIIREAKGL